MTKPKPTFEQCLDYIETTLGCKLLDWQKELLQKCYSNQEGCVMLGRRNGKVMYLKAKKLLNELLEKEN